MTADRVRAVRAAAVLLACAAVLAGPARVSGPQAAAAHAARPALQDRAAPTGTPAPVRRIVSLVPALTEILFAIGAGPDVVAVSSYDAFPPEVNALPRVGALLDPDVERILSLRPDLVLVYGSQTSQEAQFSRAGIRTFSYRHGGIETVLETIRDLGEVTGREADAARVSGEIRAQLDAVRARVRGRRRPRVLLVFERQPGTLRDIYASGGVGFLHEMLEAAGGSNVFADVPREAVQPSRETLLARAPEVVLEVQADGMIDGGDPADARAVWSALPLPAVRAGRVYTLTGQYLVVPGPRLAQATEAFARVLHPDAWDGDSGGGVGPGDAP